MNNQFNQKRVVEVDVKDCVNGLIFCPRPENPLWSAHPKVFLTLKDGVARCPYCSAVYRVGDVRKTSDGAFGD